ncbi:hypothetical protein [Dactylosporangium sp. CA-139066]|uniref:hypothetical protein n=1 Tax=Dactylosporangium sp. CA-139066 TaxID=3239930 RepID=UPI003D8EDB59
MTEPLVFTSAADLARALRRAAEAHGRHEEALGHYDEGWPEWYADFMMREERSESVTQPRPP